MEIVLRDVKLIRVLSWFGCVEEYGYGHRSTYCFNYLIVTRSLKRECLTEEADKNVR